ncbi:MAG TPA: NAD(P)/FAD-dependent oxidoreductase [Thermoleophilaceae bacterium]|nr:NAD(P)/FAD-dependent oxidoreductase [Thermoleophilaceae bacterium]
MQAEGEDRYDAVVIGAGPGGSGAAGRLADAGCKVAMVEDELVGGECPFWACIPSKALLRPVEAVGSSRHVAGVEARVASVEDVLDYRDYMNSGLDDTGKAKAFADRGVDVVRGRGRLDGPDQVAVGDRVLEAERVILATGTTSRVPDLDGLDAAGYWTNREATSMSEVPESAVVLGGGPVGIELAQAMSRLGSSVTLVHSAERLLAREEPAVGDMLAPLLSEEGIELRLGARASSVSPGEDGRSIVHLDTGEEVQGHRILVAVGREPRTSDLGLDTVGIEPGKRGIEVDERCRAAEGVYAIGDVTGVAPFTHVASYQARIVCADILGSPRPADYKAVPRVVFCDPEVACVGLTESQAREKGIDAMTADSDLSATDRTETYGRDLTGGFGVIADSRREVLVGAWAVGPLAGEWIHQAVLAVKAEVPLGVLRDSMSQFPTFSEILRATVEKLPAVEHA